LLSSPPNVPVCEAPGMFDKYPGVMSNLSEDS
jgi:hypothetical protein